MAGAKAQTRPASAGLRLLGVLAAFAPAPACAGAWIAPEGGQEIWTNVAGEREGLTYFETSAYWEIPVGRQTSFVAAPWIEQNYDTIDGYRAEATVAVKRALFRREETVVAAQAGALWMSHPTAECGETGGEVRLLAGRPIGDRAFANVEFAGRAFEGGCESQRLDLTLGYRPGANWLGIAQVFVDAPPEGEETIKAQITLVYFRQSGRGIQVGLRARIDGGEPEPALVIGLWGRPGD